MIGRTLSNPSHKLPTKEYADVSTTEGKIALRTEVMEKINSLMTKGQVNNIYFTEFVVQ